MRLLSAGVALVLSLAVDAQRAGGAAAETARPPEAACPGWHGAPQVALRGTSQLGGLSGTYALMIEPKSGRYLQQHDYGVFSEATGFDGTLGWSRDRSGASHALDSSAARALSVTQAWLARRGWCAAVADEALFKALPDETADGVSVSVWQATPRGGVTAVLRFDRDTGLPRQIELPLPFNRLITHYDDWRDSGGLKVPWAQRDEDPEDESVETLKITDVQVGTEPAPEVTFVRPARPRDYEVAAEAPAPSATVAYEDDGIARIYVPVLIEGKGPFPFEIDTGGHLILTRETAAALHLKAAGDLGSTGAGTAVLHGGVVRLQEIRIGYAVIRDQVAKVQPLSAAANDRGSKPPRAGILGLELFERFAVEINRTHRSVTFTPLENYKAPKGGVLLPIRFTEDAPVSPGSFEGIAGDFELDSGDAGPAIIEGYWAQTHGLAPRLGQGLRWSGGSGAGAYPELLSRGDLALGTLALPHQVVSYVGIPERGSESIRVQAGVIGESSLYRFNLTYDYGHQQVWIDPQPKVPERPFNRAGMRVQRDRAESLAVTFVVPDSPAAQAGLAVGDRLLAVNGIPAARLGSAEFYVIASGPPQTEVALLVAQAAGAPQLKHMVLRDLLP